MFACHSIFLYIKPKTAYCDRCDRHFSIELKNFCKFSFLWLQNGNKKMKKSVFSNFLRKLPVTPVTIFNFPLHIAVNAVTGIFFIACHSLSQLFLCKMTVLCKAFLIYFKFLLECPFKLCYN